MKHVTPQAAGESLGSELIRTNALLAYFLFSLIQLQNLHWYVIGSLQ